MHVRIKLKLFNLFTWVASWFLQFTHDVVQCGKSDIGCDVVLYAYEVLNNWEAIKLQEKPERERVLDGIYKGLPSLLRAHKIQKRVAKVGFDWTETEDVKKKVLEEWKEFNEAAALQDQIEMEKELGDLYFSLVNFARHLGLESETALNRCNNRFVTRFEHVEDRVTESEKGWSKYSLEELDRFWDEAKEAEE